MFRAGFDYSWQEASFALADENGKLLIEECKVFPPRNASGLPDWLSGLLAAKGIKLEDIAEWSVGTGPGSFTGLRVAASFVIGLCFARAVRKRGVSTASAMADGLELPSGIAKAMVLFDGHRDELLGYGLERLNGTFVPSGFHGVLNKEGAEKLSSEYDVLISLDRDAEKIRDVAGPAASAKLRTLAHIQASRLIFNQPDDFSGSLTDPVYLRPAVFVEPRLPRQL